MTAVERRSVFVHYCDLKLHEQQALSLLDNHVDNGCKRFANYQTVYKSPDSRQYFRSNRAFLKEVRRHLGNKEYKLVLHPLSRMAFYQNVFMTLVWLVLILAGPLQASFLFNAYMDGNNVLLFTIVLRFCRIMCLVHIVASFFTGYIERKTQEMVLDRKRIRRHYFRTFFFVDIWVPLVWIVLLILPSGAVTKPTRLFMYQKYYSLLGRIGTILYVIDKSMKKLRLGEKFRTCFRLIVVGLISIHWWTCLIRVITRVYEDYDQARLNNSWYVKFKKESEVVIFGEKAIGDTEDVQVFKDYMVHLSVVACHYLGMGIGRYTTKDSIELFLFAWILMTGLIFYIFAVVKLLEFFCEIDVSGRLYDELMLQATEYMTSNRFPRHLRHRIDKYYSYKYNRSYFFETQIINGLSEHLRMEVVLYSTAHLINRSTAFRGWSKAAIGSILPLLKPEIYLPKDIIMCMEDEEKKFFFLVYGTCAVTLSTNKELIHVEDGDLMSNAWSAVTGQDSAGFSYKLVAVEACQIYTLELDELRYCCLRYPSLLERVNQIASKKQRFYNELYARVMSSEEDVTGSNIMTELRRKKILMRGMSRFDYDRSKFIT